MTKADEPTPAPVEVKNADPVRIKVAGTDEPLPVALAANQVPMPVTIEEDRADHDSPAQVDAKKVSASAQVDAAALRTEDQRKISGIWEGTQRIIALAVVLNTLFVVSALTLTPTISALLGRPVDDAARSLANGGLLFLTAVSNLVIGFYFGRTNHSRVGGGENPSRDGS